MLIIKFKNELLEEEITSDTRYNLQLPFKRRKETRTKREHSKKTHSIKIPKIISIN